jgi:hypothetical protein
MQKDLISAYNQLAKKLSATQKITGCAQIQEIERPETGSTIHTFLINGQWHEW